MPGPVLDSLQEGQSESDGRGFTVLFKEDVPVSKMGVLVQQTLYGQLTVFRVGKTLAACVEAIGPTSTFTVHSLERWGWKTKGASKRCQILRLYVEDPAEERAVLAAMMAADRRPVFPAKGSRFEAMLRQAIRRVAAGGVGPTTHPAISCRP